MNEPWLGAEIYPGMALTPFPSNIEWDLNPRPSNRESSLLTTRWDVHHVFIPNTQLCFKSISKKNHHFLNTSTQKRGRSKKTIWRYSLAFWSCLTFFKALTTDMAEKTMTKQKQFISFNYAALSIKFLYLLHQHYFMRQFEFYRKI